MSFGQAAAVVALHDEGYLRMSFANSYENIVEGCKRLGEAVKALKSDS